MSRPEIEPARVGSEHSRKELDSLFAGYSEPLLGLRLAL